MIYAPQCNLGFLNYDKSGGFITIPDDYVMFTKRDKMEFAENDEEKVWLIFEYFI